MREKNYVISVDLGGTNVRVGLISSTCEIIKVYRENTIKGDKQKLTEQICRMIDSLPYEEYHVKYVGISACGFVKNNYIKYMANLNIYDYNLKKEIEERFPYLDVTIKNDADCTALSEATYGASKDNNSSFFITLSSGIGGALVEQQKLINLNFEIGHMFVEYNNNTFEVEQLLSGNGIVRLCKENNLLVNDASEFFSMVKSNDYKATNIIEIWKRKVSILIANLQLLFDVDVFVLSGGVMKSSSLFLSDLQAQANDMIRKFPLKPVILVPAEFDQDAGLIGGASIVMNS